MIWIHIVFQFRWQLTSLVIADGTNIKTISLISKYKPIDFHYHGTETKQTIIEGTQGVLERSALDAPGDARHHLKRRMRQLRLLGQGSLLLDSCRPEPRCLRRGGHQRPEEPGEIRMTHPFSFFNREDVGISPQHLSLHRTYGSRIRRYIHIGVRKL